jgi:hemin uptake protein HemP
MTEPLPQPDEPAGSPRRDKPGGSPAVVEARELFAGAREVVIEHEGVRYRLRITRRNKLILQK